MLQPITSFIAYTALPLDSYVIWQQQYTVEQFSNATAGSGSFLHYQIIFYYHFFIFEKRNEQNSGVHDNDLKHTFRLGQDNMTKFTVFLTASVLLCYSCTLGVCTYKHTIWTSHQYCFYSSRKLSTLEICIYSASKSLVRLQFIGFPCISELKQFPVL